MTGFASIMPIFYSFSVEDGDLSETDPEKSPSPAEGEKFLSKIMSRM